MSRQMPDEPLDAAGVCAIVVTHHPDDGLPARLGRILPQVRETVIVDNGSAAEAAVVRACATLPGAVLIANVENRGIAVALNQGIRHALAHGHVWALLLDQDTEVDDDIIAAQLAAGASTPDPDRNAVIGCRFRDTNDRPPETLPRGAQGTLWREVESVITSGSLLSLKNFAAIGPFREEFFIDYVDTEYCLRARARGYRIIETRRPLMSHTVGAPTAHQVFGRQKWTTNHSADRRYYIARNNTVLLREYGTSKGGSWRWKSIVRSVRLCKRIALFEQDRLAKMLAVGSGWWDGMRGRMGPRSRTAPGG